MSVCTCVFVIYQEDIVVLITCLGLIDCGVAGYILKLCSEFMDDHNCIAFINTLVI